VATQHHRHGCEVLHIAGYAHRLPARGGATHDRHGSGPYGEGSSERSDDGFVGPAVDCGRVHGDRQRTIVLAAHRGAPSAGAHVHVDRELLVGHTAASRSSQVDLHDHPSASIVSPTISS
jgi:hypothetical protein